MPVKFKYIYRDYQGRPFRLLDVGCGNHSASKTLRIFSECEYHGLDKESYNNDESEFLMMERFYRVDLSKDVSGLADIPEDYFDVIIMNHVIEHLHNGVDVLRMLVGKMRENGKLYIEFPSVKSLHLPSMRGTLNFCDDESHVRVYRVSEIANVLLDENCRIVRAGTRRDAIRIAAFPFRLLLDLVSKRQLSAATFWDITGFADYVFAEKR